MTGNKKHKIIYRKGEEGFTLLEMIVAATIFAIVISIISALFLAGVRGQRSALATQNIIENTRLAIEQMSRQIRVAQRDEVGSCTGDARTTFNSGGVALSFIDSLGRCTTYQRSGGKIQMKQASGLFLDLTSDDIVINSLVFEVSGRSATDGVQPRVTIFLDAVSSGAKPEDAVKILLQTTSSVRNLDVP